MVNRKITKQYVCSIYCQHIDYLNHLIKKGEPYADYFRRKPLSIAQKQ